MTDLERRLRDLADSAGPWDDPLPAVRRRTRLRRVQPGMLVAAAAVVLVLVGAGAVLAAVHQGMSRVTSNSDAGGGSRRAPAAAGCPPLPRRPTSSQPVRVTLQPGGLVDVSPIPGKPFGALLLSAGRVVGLVHGTDWYAGSTFTGRPETCNLRPLAPGHYDLVVVTDRLVSKPVPVTIH